MFEWQQLKMIEAIYCEMDEMSDWHSNNAIANDGLCWLLDPHDLQQHEF